MDGSIVWSGVKRAPSYMHKPDHQWQTRQCGLCGKVQPKTQEDLVCHFSICWECAKNGVWDEHCKQFHP